MSVAEGASARAGGGSAVGTDNGGSDDVVGYGKEEGKFFIF